MSSTTCRVTFQLFALLCCAIASGQTAGELPAFDVASVKPNTASRPDYIELGDAQHGVVTLHNANMKDCIRYAYGLTSNDQISGPDWMADYAVRFDIVAKAPPDTAEPVLLLMLQRLLAERFRLALHRDSKPLAHFELEVAKGGAKLPPPPEAPPKYVFGHGLLNYTHATMQELAMLLARQLKEPVLNRTALNGLYAVKLQWRPDDPQPIPETRTLSLRLSPKRI